MNELKIPNSVFKYGILRNRYKASHILTLDRFTLGDYEGIEVINAVDWLLNMKRMTSHWEVIIL